MKALRLLVIGIPLGLTACSGVNPHLVNSEFAGQLRAREGAYRLKPDDLIAVEVVGNADFTNETVSVGRDGYISTSLGSYFVSGMTVAEVQALIRREQREFPTSPPPIVVKLLTQAPEVVWVGGEVLKPGVITLRAGMSALEAVMEAGGNKPSGKMRNVILIRRSADWERVVRRVDLKVLEEDLVLLPRDVVYVPRTAIADVATFVDQYITRVIPFNYWSFWTAMGVGL